MGMVNQSLRYHKINFISYSSNNFFSALSNVCSTQLISEEKKLTRKRNDICKIIGTIKYIIKREKEIKEKSFKLINDKIEKKDTHKI